MLLAESEMMTVGLFPGYIEGNYSSNSLNPNFLS